VLGAGGNISESAFSEKVGLAIDREFDFAIENVKEALRRGGTKLTAGNELGGHLRETCAQARANVDDELHASGAGQRGADEGVWRLQQVIVLQTASRNSQVMQI
jgi:hypothetical protein